MADRETEDGKWRRAGSGERENNWTFFSLLFEAINHSDRCVLGKRAPFSFFRRQLLNPSSPSSPPPFNRPNSSAFLVDVFRQRPRLFVIFHSSTAFSIDPPLPKRQFLPKRTLKKLEYSKKQRKRKRKLTLSLCLSANPTHRPQSHTSLSLFPVSMIQLVYAANLEHSTFPLFFPPFANAREGTEPKLFHLKIKTKFDVKMDAAVDEAKKLADQMKKSAEQIQKEVRDRMNSSDPYSRVIHQLRTAHLVALGIEVFTLYLGWREVNFIWLLFPLLFSAGAIWIVAERWYHQADGRADFNKLLSNDKPALRGRAGLGLLGGFVLSLLAQWTSPIFSSSLGGLLFSLSSHAAVLIGAVCSAIELYEGVKLKNR